MVMVVLPGAVRCGFFFTEHDPAVQCTGIEGHAAGKHRYTTSEGEQWDRMVRSEAVTLTEIPAVTFVCSTCGITLKEGETCAQHPYQRTRIMIGRRHPQTENDGYFTLRLPCSRRHRAVLRAVQSMISGAAAKAEETNRNTLASAFADLYEQINQALKGE